MKKILIISLAFCLLLAACNSVTLENASEPITESADSSVGASDESTKIRDEESSITEERSESPESSGESFEETSGGMPENSQPEPSEDPFDSAVKYGDLVHLRCFKDDKYIGDAVLKVEDTAVSFIKSDEAYPESVVTELVKRVQGQSRWDEAIQINEGQHKYGFYVNMVNQVVEPSYTIPKDWDYRFEDVEVRRFIYFYDGQPIENDDADIYGFSDRLTETCSNWCGCMQFVCDASASSVLENQGKVSYSAVNLTDDTRKTVWAEGVDGLGIGETVEITQMYAGSGYPELDFYSICIVNGYAENKTKWQENGRVKSLKLYYQGEYMGLITLEDTINPQYIDISALQMKIGNGYKAEFKFEIAEVYEGSKYEDVCLTGISIDFKGIYAH